MTLSIACSIIGRLRWTCVHVLYQCGSYTACLLLNVCNYCQVAFKMSLAVSNSARLKTFTRQFLINNIIYSWKEWSCIYNHPQDLLCEQKSSFTTPVPLSWNDIQRLATYGTPKTYPGASKGISSCWTTAVEQPSVQHTKIWPTLQRFRDSSTYMYSDFCW